MQSVSSAGKTAAKGANPLNYDWSQPGNALQSMNADQFDPFNLTGSKKSTFDPYSGMPSDYPTYVGMDPNQMMVGGDYQRNDPMAKFGRESMRTGPTAGTEFALGQNQIATNQGADQARKAADGMGAQANSNLAMRGGVSAGQIAENNKTAINAGAAGVAGANNTGSMNRNSLLLSDENSRESNLKSAADLTNTTNQQNYGMRAGDLSRQQGEFDRRNAYNMNFYNQQMGAWAAGKQADATANSGKKSGGGK